MDEITAAAVSEAMDIDDIMADNSSATNSSGTNGSSVADSVANDYLVNDAVATDAVATDAVATDAAATDSEDDEDSVEKEIVLPRIPRIRGPLIDNPRTERRSITRLINERGRTSTTNNEGDESEREISPRRSKEVVNGILGDVHIDVGILQDELQQDIMELERLQSEYHQLESNNKFLQKYIGELMSTSQLINRKK